MEDLTSSRIDSTFVGRLLILIPASDFGFIEKVREGALTSKGNPASTQIEIQAVKRAKEIVQTRRLDDYVILTDNLSAAELSGVKEARWLEAGKIHYASLYLQRIMNRARYLRQSSRKVIARLPPNRLQSELYEMFKADRLEFRLSKSMLWNKIQMEMEAR